YQRKFQQIEAWTSDARISQQESDSYLAEVKEAREALETTQRVVPPEQTIVDFEKAVTDHFRARKETPPNLDKIRGAYAALTKASESSRPDRRAELKDAMSEIIAAAKFREDNLLSAKKFKAADFEVARSEYELGVGNELAKSRLDDLLAKTI